MRKVKSIFVMALAMLSFNTAAVAGDIEVGKIKAETCLGCHGIVGYNNTYPTYKVPMLGGQHAEYLEAALKAYRDGSRQHDTMHANAENLSDQDIADIAAYFANH